MDLSDLPQAACSRIAAAEIQADSILANSHAAAEALRLKTDCSEVNTSPYEIALEPGGTARATETGTRKRD